MVAVMPMPPYLDNRRRSVVHHLKKPELNLCAISNLIGPSFRLPYSFVSKTTGYVFQQRVTNELDEVLKIIRDSFYYTPVVNMIMKT
jgi:hypothetical protein